MIVFCFRYLDIFWNFNSMYNWVMKIIFISSSVYIIHLMTQHKQISQTYRGELEKLKIVHLLVPCAVVALVFIHKYTLSEYLWTISIYLEAVAILPQLMMVHERAARTKGFVENLTSHYVFTLGGYRAMYLLNWIYRYFTEKSYFEPIVWFSGLIQTVVYCDFFYYYLTTPREGEGWRLPTSMT